MIRIAFLRHGPTEWNRAGRIQGRSDIPLDADAQSELATLSLPPVWSEAQVWTSPLQRAVQTAQALSAAPPAVSGDLTEMHWGAFEGQRGEDLIGDPASGYRHLEDWGWTFRPPGGETPRAVANRVSRWMQGLTEDAVAVCHIGVIRAALALAHGWDFTGTPPFQIKRKRLYGIVRAPEGLRPLDTWRLIDEGSDA